MRSPLASAARGHPSEPVVVTGVGVVVAEDARTAAGRAGAAGEADWFDVGSELGPRGYRYLPPAAQYLLAAARRALAATGGAMPGPPQRRAVVVGTNSGAAALLDAMDRTVIDSDATELSPATAPFFAINVLGSRVCAEHQIQGFSLTLTSPVAAGLEAVQVGVRAITAGRADLLLAGVTEARLPSGAVGAAASEAGAGVLLLERAAAATARNAPVLGTCQVRTFFLPPRQARTRDGEQRARSLVAVAVDATPEEQPTAAYVVHDDSPVARAVVGALVATGVPVVGADAAAGDRAGGPQATGAGALAPLLRVAALLTEPPAGAPGSVVLVLTATRLGNVAVAHVRCCGTGDSRRA